MRVLMVYAHPEPKSFNGAMRDRAVAALTRAGHAIEVSDLYAEKFDPVAGRHDFESAADQDRFHYQSEQAAAARNDTFAPDLKREQDRLRRADFLIFQFPLWHGGVPAILKGWMDRVLAYGISYVDGRRYDTGLFRGRRALVAVTTGGTPQRFSESYPYGPIERVLWQPQRMTLEYMGFEVEQPFIAYAAPRVSDAERAAYLDAYETRLVQAAAKPVEFKSIGDPLALVAEKAWSSR